MRGVPRTGWRLPQVPAAHRRNAGVAVYAYWTTDDEWRHYRTTWLGFAD